MHFSNKLSYYKVANTKSSLESLSITRKKQWHDKGQDLHMLQRGMEQHAPNRKYHIGYVKNSKSLFKPLSQGIYKANECQKNAWDI